MDGSTVVGDSTPARPIAETLKLYAVFADNPLKVAEVPVDSWLVLTVANAFVEICARKDAGWKRRRCVSRGTSQARKGREIDRIRLCHSLG